MSSSLDLSPATGVKPRKRPPSGWFVVIGILGGAAIDAAFGAHHLRESLSVAWGGTILVLARQWGIVR